ncbi:MAG: phosphoenolpyruvate carboxylase [Vicinamibacteria bacterium]|nr:phosphoenolpyruvate carboxylase [Vicinamibacteria bacterium]
MKTIEHEAVLERAANTALSLLAGETTLEDLHQRLRAEASLCLADRVAKIAGQVHSWNVSENDARVRTLIERLAKPDGKLLPFEQFAKQAETQMAGFVITAHPTFSLSEDAREAIHAMLRARVSDGEAEAPPATDATAFRVRPERSPTLDEELVQSEVAVRHIRLAIRRIHAIGLEVARRLYPDEWRSLSPNFLTVASWVGFDLDGRTDIGWSRSVMFRYRTALAGIAVLDEFLREIGEGGSAKADKILADISQGLATFSDCFKLGMQALDQGDGLENLGRLNRLAVTRRADKEAAMLRIDQALADLMSMDLDEQRLLQISAFRAEWKSLGLGLSHIHFRLNAVQLHNAIRPQIGRDRSPDRSASRRHYLAAISELLDGVTPVNVHYGTLAREQTTAKRLFMLAAQFEKHFDDRTPIRVLVAESDTPFTLLTALYYARLFGVDKHVEISPLFETAVGLQRGDRVIAELLDNPHFRAYVQAQGRFCVQLGFSDSGRYIGQPAATLAIERFKLRLIRLWKARDLGHIQLLFFDTHGESIGRGAHPRSLFDRFLYVHPERVRAMLSGLSAPHKHEVSFQGGDGFLWFVSPASAQAALTDFLEVRIGEIGAEPDALYDDSGWSLDFFLTLKEYQDDMAAHPGYVRLLDSMVGNFLYPTGSRAVKRQGGSGKTGRLESVGQMRAIPHNAMLQGLGYLANSVAGLGLAIDQSPDRFAEILAGSRRLRRIVSLVMGGRARSDIGTLDAYVRLLTPGYWLDLSGRVTDEAVRDRARRLSKVLEHLFDHSAITSLVRTLRRDAALLEDALSRPDLAAALGEERAEVGPLHTARLALIQFVFLKAMEVPRFSSRLDISLDELVERLLRLEIKDAIGELRTIFPVATQRLDDESYGEDATYRSATTGYAQEHAQIFDPIETAHGLILELTGLIGLKIGAFG